MSFSSLVLLLYTSLPFTFILDVYYPMVPHFIYIIPLLHPVPTNLLDDVWVIWSQSKGHTLPFSLLTGLWFEKNIQLLVVSDNSPFFHHGHDRYGFY